MEAITRETDDAVSLTLASPDGAAISFKPGQFLTLTVPVAGATHRRAYSIASSAHDPSRVTVTVRRVAGGLVSNHLNDHARVGDTFAVHGPSGAFVVEGGDARRHLVLVAGGSGITPMMSFLRTHLGASPTLAFTLVYGNRDRAHAIFADALDALAAAHPTQLTVRHVYERAPDGSALDGRLDESGCARAFEALTLPGDVTPEWFLCGPDPMMAAARTVLAARGVAPERVHEERFFTAATTTKAAGDQRPHTVTVRLRGSAHVVSAAPGVTVLDAGLNAGVDMPFSCTMGGCGACRVRLTAGDVVMDEPNCLTAREREKGYVLACQSRPTGDITIEVEP